MDNRSNMLQLCRLCLVKDDVNIPIFEEHGDIRQIFLKITSCLPVKVSRDDKLPKKICDGCSYKLETLYEFWNTSVNAEKQLLAWLGEAGMNSEMADGTITAVAQQIKPTDTFVKQETVDPPDVHSEDHDQKDYVFQQKFESASAGPSATVTSNEEEEPPPKRARRTAAVKAAIAMDRDSDDDDDSGEPITKVEDESEESDGEDHTFADAPSTSADDQPGPSGVGKDGVDAPDKPIEKENRKTSRSAQRGVRSQKKYYAKSDNSDGDYDYLPVTKRSKQKASKQVVEIVVKKSRKHYDLKKQWPCKKCNTVLSTKRKLLSHRKLEHPKIDIDEHTYKFDELQELYVCNTCSAEYIEKDEVEKHVKGHEEKFECIICNEKFKKAYDFGTHIYTHDPEKLFRCPLCPYITPKRTGFLVHINYTHLRKFGYGCDTCGKGFNDIVLYKEHNNEHLGVKPFACIVCSKTFTYSRYLLTHQVRSHRVGIEGQLLPNQCSVCNKVFSKVATLQKHMEERHVKNQLPHAKKHLCDTCGKGFAQKNKLRVHYRVHTGIKPYTCTYCAKSFTKKDYLVMHERVHSGEKPYSCKFCGKCFSQGAPLRIHLRTHTGERPYICQFCTAGFTSRGALNMHCRNCAGSM